ncbi:MAG: zinc-binding dehydrogenase [Enterocloster bolteae]
MAMKLSRAMGASRILVVGRMPRLEAAGNLEAQMSSVDFSKCNPVDEVRRLTGGLGANLVLECSGAPGTITQSLGMCCKGGKVVMLGVAKDGVTRTYSLKIYDT